MSIVGCIVGGALGDAVGSAHENGMPGGSWKLTDDTQLTLATCEALLEGPPEPARIATHLVRWYRERRIHGIGSSTLKAMRDLAAGQHWALAGRSGERAAGNGSAIRIAPLAFFGPSRTLIRDVSRITHHNEEAYVGAVALCKAVEWAHLNGSAPALADIADLLPNSLVRDRLSELAGARFSVSEAAARFGNSGYVVESVPLALLASHLPFAEMTEQLISAGGDTDSNASMAGQVIGAALGLDALPADWLGRLPDREAVFSIAERFQRSVKR